MARATGEMTVAQLERELEKKKDRLTSLMKRRNSLLNDLSKVERQIQEIGGRDASMIPARRKRPKNKQSLRAYVVEILSRNKKGLTIGELHDRVAKTDYKSRSANFKNVLYQTLYNTDDIVHNKESGPVRSQGLTTATVNDHRVRGIRWLSVRGRTASSAGTLDFGMQCCRPDGVAAAARVSSTCLK